MKFYYEGKLIRTSKNHHYTNALINTDTGKCITCSSTMEGCERELNRIINEKLNNIENAKKAILAIENGKKTYMATYGRDICTARVTENIEHYQKSIKYYQERIENIKVFYKIVDLEEIA